LTEKFTYTANIGNDNKQMTSPPPLWSDFDPNSKFAMMARRAKQVNDSSFCETMRKVFDHDSKTLPMERFKVWASSLIIPIANTFKCHEQISYALNLANLYPEAKRAITDPIVGCTQQDFDSMFKVFDNANISMNRIQALYGLSFGTNNQLFNDIRENNISSVIEIGAGIGDMADVCRKLGYHGQYTVYDFPELLKLQKWYHHNQPGLLHGTNKYVSQPEDVNSADLCIATWSLTEMPFALRDELVDRLIDTPRWLVAFSNKIFGYDNHEYIMNVLLPKLGVTEDQLSLIPVVYDNVNWDNWEGGTYYLYIDKTKHTS